MAQGLRERLIGAWKLVSYVERPVDSSEPFYPMGEKPQGLTMYTPDGYMSAQLMHPDRPTFASGDWFSGSDHEIRHEALGYIAYSGPFHADEQEQTLTHSMFVSLFPNWLGQTQPRMVKIEGEMLYLSSATPIRSGGKETMSYSRGEGPSLSEVQPSHFDVASAGRRFAMSTTTATASEPILKNLDQLVPDLEALYKDVHSHPELSMQETRTAGLVADRIRTDGFEVTTGVGKTGVVGLLRNGEGPTVMLRADMDALPIEEATGLPYASKVKMKDRQGNTVPVGHMCGHDMHVTCLIGATKLFAQTRDAWHGTVLAVFQPGEETAEGAQAMIDDGLFDRFPKPAVVLGQHVMVGPSGAVAGRTGAITSAADSLQIRLFGRGAHGSMPQASIDPVVMAAATVLRLQTIVSREVAAAESAVVTVGALQAGTKENVIPDEALIKLNVRTFDEGVRKRVLTAIERIVNAEAAASGAPRPPEITTLDRYPLNVNDPEASARVANAFRRYFPADRVRHTGAAPASEDFGSFGTEWHAPSVFWFIGGTDPDTYAKAKEAGRLNELPVNHSPLFAPVIHPTLETGVEALIVAARAWLAP